MLPHNITALTIDNEKLLNLGLSGLIEETAQHRAALDLSRYDDLKKEQFLKSVDIVLNAVKQHILRYADLALEMSKQETRASRRKELEAIAENCFHIAESRPESFWQALQLSYFVQLILQIESNGP